MSEADEVELPNPDLTQVPTWAEILRQFGENLKGQINVCAPATVVSYDRGSQTITAQLLFQNKYLDGSFDAPPIISRVPVVFPRAGNAFISFPLKQGDHVVLVFSDRSIEKWQPSGASNYPEDTRQHDLTDAFAIPGGYPESKPSQIANGDDLIVSNALGQGGTEARFKPNGHVQILNGLGEEIVSVISSFMASACYGDLGGMYAATARLQTFLEK